MRWSIIRLIWFRELRDQLRDRRTMFMVVVLPVLLYPILGVGVVQFALAFMQNPSKVGVYGVENLPQASPLASRESPLPVVAWISLTPGHGLDRVAGTMAWYRVAWSGLGLKYPPLINADTKDQRFLSQYFDKAGDAEQLHILSWPLPPGFRPGVEPTADMVDGTPLEKKEVDLILIIPPDFTQRLHHGVRPSVRVLTRDGDDRSRLVGTRVHAVLNRWRDALKQVRFMNQGLPGDFDKSFDVVDQAQDKSAKEQVADGLADMLARLFPLFLVIWSLTGALYPAVDLCAGEKERGTMETLLISPAGREEIVYGKFLTIWVFSAGTALLNLASMGLTTALLGGQLPLVEVVRPGALLWCVLLVLPLSAFFSALCLALGAYARSTKEGQYYLMPMFLVTMPLIFLTLVPGVELNPLYSLVPVTGVALLLQRLMTATTLEKETLFYFVPVLVPTMLYGWLALRWAVLQFNREEVLFREAERLDLRLWLQKLLRDKEPVPTVGQALFCFALIAGLRWFSLSFGSRLHLLLHTAIDLVAFVITPPLLMAVLLTSQPTVALQLRWPPRRAILTAVLLAVTLAVPLVEVADYFLRVVPGLEQMLSDNDPLAKEILKFLRGQADLGTWWQYPMVLALLASVCEEVAFRGFILTGLRRRFKPWTAILLSSVLFALSHLNVFQLIPMFFLGVILGVLATRSGSIVPGLVFHGVHNTLVLVLLMLPRYTGDLTEWLPPLVRSGFVIVCAAGAILYLLMSGYRLWAYGPWSNDEARMKS